MSGIIKRRIYGSFGDLIEHHAIGGFGRTFRNYLFGQVLADGLALAVRVGGKIDGVRVFGGLLQFRHDSFVVSFSGVRNYFVGWLEIIVDINSQAFGRQIFDVAYRGFNQIVLSQIFIDCFRLRRRFNDDQIFCHGLNYFRLPIANCQFRLIRECRNHNLLPFAVFLTIGNWQLAFGNVHIFLTNTYPEAPATNSRISNANSRRS